MKKASTRPSTTPTKPSKARETSFSPRETTILPNLSIGVSNVAAIQREINVLLNVDPTQPSSPNDTIQTKLRLIKQTTAAKRSSRHCINPPVITVTLPSPQRYTPRAETRQAIKTFRDLFVGPGRTPRDPLVMELDLDDEPSISNHKDDETYIAKVADLLVDASGEPLSIPKTPRHDGWSIKDVKNNHGWGGKVKFMAEVRRNKLDMEASPVEKTILSDFKVDAADVDQVSTDTLQCASKYIGTCLKMDLTPEPFIIPKHESCAIDLSYYGMGSKPMDAISSCLSGMPKLQTLVVKENRLCDTAIANILESSDFSRLLTLNLSKNPIRHRSTRAFETFLNHNRVVQTLILSDCDLHSDFLTAIQDALAANASLTHLDLSKNKLDDFSADALSAICTDNSNLALIELSWNSLRARAAAGLATALEHNQSLQSLHLGWNGIGHGDGAQRIAHALRNNMYLQKLDLTANSVSPEATLALTNTWAESMSLDILVLDQNPIGTEGLRSIFRAYSNPITKTQGRTIQCDDCTLHHNDIVFDPETSGGHHEIDMADAKSFWRTLEILRLANLYPSACVLENVVLTTPLEFKHLQFHRVVATNQTVDSEKSPTTKLLALLHHGDPWRVPLTGSISFDFKYDARAINAVDIQSDAVEMFWDMYSSLEYDSERAKYMKLFLHDHYITADQAKKFLGSIASIDRHADLVHMLMQKVSDAENLFSISSKPQNLPAKHQSFLNECAGKMLFFDSNLPNGHYSLDLTTAMDQRLASVLFRISGDDKLRNKQTEAPNTSQKGNWECFRNESLNGEPYNFARSVGLPDRGTFVFDFVATSRPIKGTTPLDPDKFDTLCHDVTRTNHTPMGRAVSTLDMPDRRVNSQHDYETRRAELKRAFGFGLVGITAKQLALLAECFRDVDHGRVDCVVLLLNRVIDLDELFVLLRSSWTAKELHELVHRVGWLNIWNPAHAEMEYTLNLAVWEEHQMALILALLGDMEPGENWVDETYNNIFGWELPLSWVQGKIPHVGRLFLRYTTGSNNKNRVLTAREGLKKRTLCGKPLKQVDASAPNKIRDHRDSRRRRSIHQIAL
ncbi:hypothetical protein LEN26_007191 [Aphanomyces euteiches]|nr:hypothetical protein LEN26_007191 [Aphanomyces euteiches]